MVVKVAFRYNPKSPLTNIISWWTAPLHYKFTSAYKNVANHCEIIICGNRYSSDATVGKWRRTNEPLHGDWRVYNIEVTKHEHIRMMSKAESFIGAKYDWVNIVLSDLFKRDIGSNNRLTCDEGVARILKLSHRFMGITGVNNMNPHKLEESIRYKWIRVR